MKITKSESFTIELDDAEILDIIDAASIWYDENGYIENAEKARALYEKLKTKRL